MTLSLTLFAALPCGPCCRTGSDFGLRTLGDVENVALAVQEPGRFPPVSGGNAVLRLQAWKIVFLKDDAAASQFLHLAVEIVGFPGHLGVLGRACVLCLVE